MKNFRDAQAQFEADRERAASDEYDYRDAEYRDTDCFEDPNLEERAERSKRYANWW